MSPLEAARRLLDGLEPHGMEGQALRLRVLSGGMSTGYRYWFCDGAAPMADGHAPDCPWLAAPRILATLETFERILPMFLRGSYLDDDGMPTVWTCENCGGQGRTQDGVEHSATCRIGLMVAALRGEGVAV